MFCRRMCGDAGAKCRTKPGRNPEGHGSDEPLYRLCHCGLVRDAVMRAEGRRRAAGAAAAIIGAALVFNGASMLMGGIQIVMSRPVTMRSTFIVGISLLFALSRRVYPEFFTLLPPWTHAFTDSILSSGRAARGHGFGRRHGGLGRVARFEFWR